MITLPSRRTARHAAIGQLGVTLFEVVLGLGVMGIAMTGLASMQMNQTVEMRNQTAAQSLRVVRDAARRYVRDNFNDVFPASVGDTAEITATDLITAGYLPPQYVAAGAIRQNSYGQSYRILVRRPGTAGSPPTGTEDTDLELLVVTTGGTAIPDNTIGQVASMVGADGGFICTGAAEGYCTSAQVGAQVARGAYGGWEVDMSTYGTGFSTGRLAATANFGQGEIVTDYLYRYAVPGLPEANRMFTNLDMGSYRQGATGTPVLNNINNVSQVNAVDPIVSGSDVTAARCVTAQMDGTSGTINVYTNQANGCNRIAQISSNGTNGQIATVRRIGSSTPAAYRTMAAMNSGDTGQIGNDGYSIAAFDTNGIIRAALRTDGRLQLRSSAQGVNGSTLANNQDGRITLNGETSEGIWRDTSQRDRVVLRSGAVNPEIVINTTSGGRATGIYGEVNGSGSMAYANWAGSTRHAVSMSGGVNTVNPLGGLAGSTDTIPTGLTTYDTSGRKSVAVQSGIDNSILTYDPANGTLPTNVVHGSQGYMLTRTTGMSALPQCGTELGTTDTSQLNTVCLKANRGGSGGDIWMGRVGWLSDQFRWWHYDTYVRTSGGIVPYPPCRAGTQPKVVVTPGTFIQPLQFNQMASGAAFRVAATAVSGGWQVYVQTAEYPSTSVLTGSVVAMTYCYRP